MHCPAAGSPSSRPQARAERQGRVGGPWAHGALHVLLGVPGLVPSCGPHSPWAPTPAVGCRPRRPAHVHSLTGPRSSDLPARRPCRGQRSASVRVCMEHPPASALTAFSRCGRAAAWRQMDGRPLGQTDAHAFDVRVTLLISRQKVKPSSVLSPRPSPPGRDRVISASVLRVGAGPSSPTGRQLAAPRSCVPHHRHPWASAGLPGRALHTQESVLFSCCRESSPEDVSH